MTCKQSVIHINILLSRFKSAQKRFLKSISCPYMLCYVMLCYVMLCYVMLCFVMLWLLLTGYMKENPRRSWILNSTPWNPDHQILDSRFPETVEVGFKIPIVSGIPDSLSLFRILQANIYWILETLLDLTWGDHTLWVILTKSFRYLVT